MRSVFLICLTLATAKELAVNQNDNKQNSMDELLEKLFDKLVDRVNAMDVPNAAMDQTTLAKPGTALAKPSLNTFPAASISPLAMSRPQLGAMPKDIQLFKCEVASGPVATNALPGNYMSQPPSCTTTMSVPAMQNTLRMMGARSSPLEKLALTALAASRDVSMRAQVKNEFSSMDSETQAKVEQYQKAIVARASILKPEDMPGITAPMGFFDPLGKAKDNDGANLYFYREVELAHGRWGMMASLGILVTETLGFHPFIGDKVQWKTAVLSHFNPVGPFFSDSIDFFWLALYGLIITAEAANPFFKDPAEAPEIPGDLGWDPLGLKPKDAKGLKEMQNKELNNGRLAMLAAAGMIAQEVATGKPILPR